MALTDKLTSIADAIRAKTGSTETMTLDQMPIEIENIECGQTSGSSEEMLALLDGTATTFNIPDGAENINGYTFYHCSNLKAFEVSEDHQNYSEIDGVLYTKDADTLVVYPVGREDIEFTLPKSAVNIASCAFAGCKNLKVVIVHDDISRIDDSAFAGTDAVAFIKLDASILNNGGIYSEIPQGITAIMIPEDAQYLDYEAFTNLTDITSVYYNANCQLETTQVILKIEYPLVGPFQKLSSTLTNVIIGPKVTEIPAFAFSFCLNVSNVNILENVTSIGEGAFADLYHLREISIPKSVKNIGTKVFFGCRELTSVEMQDGLETIGDGAFSYCSLLTNVTIPDSVTKIGSGAFQSCSSLTSIIIPDGVTTIEHDAFNNCTNLTIVVIPDNVTKIDGYAFAGCSSLTNASIPDSVTEIGSNIFTSCTSLTNVTIGSGVTTIENYTFSGCTSLTDVTIPDNVVTIGNGAFYNCTNLTNITIPNNVTHIGQQAFSDCYNLTSVTIPASVTSIAEDAFSNCDLLSAIRGYTGTYAETWAASAGLTFEAITD